MTTKTLFLAANENGNQFVKDVDGKPAWYSTWERDLAHLFEDRAEAEEWAKGQFRGRGKVVGCKKRTIQEMDETEGTRMVRYDGFWMSENERAMWEDHNL